MTLEQKKKEIETLIQEQLKQFIGVPVDTLDIDKVQDIVTEVLNTYLQQVNQPIPIPTSVNITGNTFILNWE